MFDSHSLDERGLSIVNESSVLLKFKYLIEHEKYIQIAYLQYRDIQNMYIQIQFVSINIEESIRKSMYIYYRKISVNICKKRKQNFSRVIDTPMHDELKSKKRLRNIQF